MSHLGEVGYAGYAVAAVAGLTAVFAAGYGMGVATRIVTGLLRLALLVALAGGLCWAAWQAWPQGGEPAKSTPASVPKAMREPGRPRR